MSVGPLAVPVREQIEPSLVEAAAVHLAVDVRDAAAQIRVASLLAHAATAISIAYFDQSVVFIYLTLGLTTSLSVVSRTAFPLPESDTVLTDKFLMNDTTSPRATEEPITRPN